MTKATDSGSSRLRIEVELSPDETLPGAYTARAVGLSGCRTTLKPNEDPWPVLDSMLQAYFAALGEQEGELERVLGELGVDYQPGQPLDISMTVIRSVKLELV